MLKEAIRLSEMSSERRSERNINIINNNIYINTQNDVIHDLLGIMNQDRSNRPFTNSSTQTSQPLVTNTHNLVSQNQNSQTVPPNQMMQEIPSNIEDYDEELQLALALSLSMCEK